MTFEQWRAQVDAQVEALAGLSTDDLPDMPYYDMYDDGVTPVRAARRAIREARDY